MSKRLTKKKTRQRGQGLVEYALILVLVAVVVILVLSLVGEEIKSVFSEVQAALGGGSSGSPPTSCTLTTPCNGDTVSAHDSGGFVYRLYQWNGSSWQMTNSTTVSFGDPDPYPGADYSCTDGQAGCPF